MTIVAIAVISVVVGFAITVLAKRSQDGNTVFDVIDEVNVNQKKIKG